MAEGGAVAVQSDDGVTGNNETRRLEDRVRERQLGRKTLEVEILKEALTKSLAKTGLACRAAAEARFPVKAAAETRGVPRSNPVERLKGGAEPRRRHHKAQDGERSNAMRSSETANPLALVRRLIDARPIHGYRRITASLNRDPASESAAPINH